VPRFSRIWNGRTWGIPSALVLTVTIVLRIVRDRLATLLWRGNLGSMGHGSSVQAGVTIRVPGNVHVGARTSIARGVEIGTEKGDSTCRIGSEVIIGVGVRLDFSGDLVIGDGVVISEHSTIFTHAHGLDPKSSSRKTPLEVEADVWIGCGVIIVEGASRIGRGSVVATGAVVTREVPAGCVVGGVPARIIKHNAKRCDGGDPVP